MAETTKNWIDISLPDGQTLGIYTSAGKVTQIGPRTSPTPAKARKMVLEAMRKSDARRRWMISDIANCARIWDADAQKAVETLLSEGYLRRQSGGYHITGKGAA